eukprot:12450414-Heterocapsa_arctica.AAC.1
MKWHGDHSIPTFLYLWRHIVSRMKIQLPPAMLMDTLRAKMETSMIMAHDIAYFNRCDTGHPIGRTNICSNVWTIASPFSNRPRTAKRVPRPF